MYKKYSFLIILFFTIFTNSFSQKVKLYGIGPNYKNETLSIYTYTDFISKNKQKLADFTIDSTGKFDCEIELNETKFVFFDIDIFHCVLYAKPSDKIFINLPKRTEKQVKDAINPYFEPVEFYVGMNDTTDLNFQIKTFDDILDKFMTEKFINIHTKPNKAEIEFFIHRTEGRFANANDLYFLNYRKFKYAFLKNASYIMDYKRMTMDYFHNKPILYNNVAYMELFNNLFENFLAQYSTTSLGKNLVNDVEYAKSISAIKKTLSKSIEFSNDTLQEMIALKGIHDAFFIRNIIQYPTFSKVQLHNVLDSIEMKTKIAEHKIIAQNIRQKAKYLSAGTQAPNFTLYKNDKTQKSLDDYNGKYIYLNFCNTNSRECREDFEMLKLIDKKFKNLEIISISTDENFAEAQEFFKKMKYSWTLLDFKNDKQILEKYKIEVFPTYCLIDENKNIMMYPAYSPRQNIEQYLNKIYNENKNIKINEYDELFKKPIPIKN